MYLHLLMCRQGKKNTENCECSLNESDGEQNGHKLNAFTGTSEQIFNACYDATNNIRMSFRPFSFVFSYL